MGISGDRGLSSRLSVAKGVQRGSVSLQRGDGTVLGCYPIQPCRHAGIDVDNPGEVDWVYLRDENLLIFDLGDGLGEEDRT